MIIQPGNFAFIDAQNLYQGVKSQGWEVDYRRLRRYLRDKYNVTKAILFIGYIAERQLVYDFLRSCGYEIVFKPTVVIRENGKERIKGNVDAELVLHAAAVEYENYGQAVIITGDGDFACLVEFLEEKGKLCRVIAPSKEYSKLLKKYRDKVVVISKFKDKIKSQEQRSVD
ncbi:hypothetical protein AGMMS49957_00330 [Synergistales bacterium]|nr:hypothetical protein AGMMS49957_00330 [Synergistales bacterium]